MEDNTYANANLIDENGVLAGASAVNQSLK